MAAPKTSAFLLRDLCERMRSLADGSETEAARAEVEAALASKWWSVRVMAIRTLGRWGGAANKAWLIERTLGAESGWAGGRSRYLARRSWPDLAAQTAAEALRPLLGPQDAGWVLDRWFSDEVVASSLQSYLALDAPIGPIEARVTEELARRRSRQAPLAIAWIAYLRRDLPGRVEILQGIARRDGEARTLARAMLGWIERNEEPRAAARPATPKKGAAASRQEGTALRCVPELRPGAREVRSPSRRFSTRHESQGLPEGGGSALTPVPPCRRTDRGAMPRRPTIAVLAALFALGPAAAGAQTAPSLAIEARLFGSKTGKLSENIFGPNGPFLGNAIIGDDPSTSTFVTVRVAPGRKLGEDARIRLIATEIERPAEGLRRGRYRPRVLLDRSVRRPLIDEGQKDAYVGFLVEPTGCVPVDLTVELLDPPRPKASMSARLDFRCYE